MRTRRVLLITLGAVLLALALFTLVPLRAADGVSVNDALGDASWVTMAQQTADRQDDLTYASLLGISFKRHLAYGIFIHNTSMDRPNGHRGFVLQVYPPQAGVGRRTLGEVTSDARFAWPQAWNQSAYAPAGTVAISSRAGITIKVTGHKSSAQEVAQESQLPATYLTLLPADWAAGVKDLDAEQAVRSQLADHRGYILTDATKALFDAATPAPGNPVLYYDPARHSWEPLADSTTGAELPEFLMIAVFQEMPQAAYLEIENWTTGDIKSWRRNGAGPGLPPGFVPRDGRVILSFDPQSMLYAEVGTVMQRVTGVGHFEETGLSGHGQIASASGGGLTISTTGLPAAAAPAPLKEWLTNPPPPGQITSGFHIVPCNYARYGVRGLQESGGASTGAIGGPQWLIVGPPRKMVGMTMLSGEGTPPELLSALVAGLQTPENRQSGETSAAQLLQLLKDSAGYLITPETEGMAPLYSAMLSPKYRAEESTTDVLPTKRMGFCIRISRDFGQTWERLPRANADAPTKNTFLSPMTNIRIWFPTP